MTQENKDKQMETMYTAFKQIGEILGFFICAMLAVIVVLHITWPFIDQVLNSGSNLAGYVPLIMTMAIAIVFIRSLL